MSDTIAAAVRPIPIPASKAPRSDAAAQAFIPLRVTVATAPILLGFSCRFS